MEHYVIALSKYFIAIFLALYTYECFAVFRFQDEERRKGIYTRQIILMFFFHFSAFLTICVQTGELQYLFFYAFQQLAIFATLVLFELFYPTLNRLIVHNMCMLLTIGFIILTRLSFEKAMKQFIIVVISLVISMIIPHFIYKMKFLKNLSWLYALIGIISLGIVLLLGSITNGSKISYTIAGITFQPSEFVKIIFVFFIASALYQSSTFLHVVYVTLVAAVHVLILVVSKDLGGALIFFMTYVLMVYLATHKIRYLLLGLGGGCAASIVAYQIFSHIQTRVQAWRDPWSVIDGDGYQITQSLFSLGRGELFGLGLFKGAPDDIPFVEQDFIFSAVVEEMGLIVGLCLILICLSCFIMFMNISMKLKDRFYQLVAFGLGVLYIFQIFLTIGGDTKFIPLTGVTLPLVSYGGSSVLTTLIMFSIIEGLFMIRLDEGAKSARRKQKATRRETTESEPSFRRSRQPEGERQPEDDGQQEQER